MYNGIEPWLNEWSLHTSRKCCRTKLVVDGALAPNVSSFIVEFVWRVFRPINWTRNYILQEIVGELDYRLNYHLVQQEQPILIPASESVKTCILQYCQKVYPKDDDKDFVNLVALMVGFDICNAWSPQDCEVHLLSENLTAVLRATKQLTAHELHDIQHISRFVVCIGLYLQPWFTSRIAK